MLNSITTNVAAYSAQQNIGRASTHAGASIARLSSGERITRAADDVAALSVGTSLRTQVTTLRQALVNSAQGSSLLQVADGALQQVTDILQRQKAISVQAGSGSLTDSERGFLNQEFQSLVKEIDRIVGSTTFNGVQLLGGGLNTSTTKLDTDAVVVAANFDAADNTATSVVGIKAIQAYNAQSGAERNGNAAAGELTFVQADGTTEAVNGAYLAINPSIAGKFDSFDLSNVVYGATNVGTATLTVSIGGLDFTGNIVGGATNVTVANGETRMRLTFTAINLTNAATTEVSKSQLGDDFKDTSIYHTRSVSGVDFSGTTLLGAVGVAAGAGNAVIRTDSPTAVDIRNFNYVSNQGANTNILTVEVNGETWTASGVLDAVNDGHQITFENGKGEALMLDVTGLDTNITNIRTDMQDRAGFINALNTGFSRAGGGLEFNIGAEASDSINVQIGSASTNSLYGGEILDVASSSSASFASGVLDTAIKTITSIRADVGALQSRFDFASANVESSIQNQDAARGVLLDTDIAAESTAFATAQVQLQAGISVLAQANLLPQNLLKLIG